MAIIYFFKVLFSGLVELGRQTYSLLKQLLLRLPFWERVHWFFSLLCLVLLLQPWRGYDIALGEQMHYHRIYSDDFLLFVILFGASLSPAIFYFADGYAQEKYKNVALVVRLLGLGAVLLLFFLNVLFAERVANTTEASFTWQFYLFGISVLIDSVVGYMGIKFMPSTPLRVE